MMSVSEIIGSDKTGLFTDEPAFGISNFSLSEKENESHVEMMPSSEFSNLTDDYAGGVTLNESSEFDLEGTRKRENNGNDSYWSQSVLPDSSSEQGEANFLKMKNDQLQSLVEQVIEKDKIIASLRTKVSEVDHKYKIELKKREIDSSSKDGNIKHLKNELASKEMEIKALQSRMDDEIKKLKTSLMEKERSVALLQKKFEEAVENHKKELVKMQAETKKLKNEYESQLLEVKSRAQRSIENEKAAMETLRRNYEIKEAESTHEMHLKEKQLEQKLKVKENELKLELESKAKDFLSKERMLERKLALSTNKAEAEKEIKQKEIELRLKTEERKSEIASRREVMMEFIHSMENDETRMKAINLLAKGRQ